LSRGSVRLRTTALAVLVVGIATAAGLTVLGFSFRASLLGELETSARLRAADLAEDLATGGDVRIADTEDLLVQVIDGTGAVSASSPNVSGLPGLARPAPDDAQEVSVPVDPGSYLVVTDEIGTSAAPRTLLVGVSTEGVGESTRRILGLVAIGLPILLLVVAATTWVLVGRTLAPVEAIRRDVASISAAGLHRRVPDLPGSDEISRLAQTMNEMLGRLEEAQERQRRFVSDASHELRTPVASIRQHAEVALAHPGRSSLKDLAETVLTEDLRIQYLVSDLLLLAAADEQSPLTRSRPVDLDDLVFAVAADLRARDSLRVDTTAVSAGRITGDERGLRRALNNLAENAARHAHSKVAFALTTQNGTVILAVDDDGPGIPEPDRRRVLERFVRLDTTRARDTGGSGLGLAIVTELITAHSGSIVIDESPLGGACVTIRLPTCPT
jgi:signal transduction histidine kinase